MRVYPEQLSKHLTRLSACYLLFGDELWHIQSALEKIKAFAKQQGFTETLSWVCDAHFCWSDVVLSMAKLWLIFTKTDLPCSSWQHQNNI